MGNNITEQLLRLMLFAKLFGFNLQASSIWQLENIWLEIGKYLMKDINKSTTAENVKPIEQIDNVAMEYVMKLRYVT